MDPDSQQDTGEEYKQDQTLKNNEKVQEKTNGKRVFGAIISYGSIPMSSRLFRAFWSNDGDVQPFLRWYSSRFLPIIGSAIFVLYILAK